MCYGFKLTKKINDKYNEYTFYVDNKDIYAKTCTERAAKIEFNKFEEILDRLEFNDLIVKNC